MSENAPENVGAEEGEPGNISAPDLGIPGEAEPLPEGDADADPDAVDDDDDPDADEEDEDIEGGVEDDEGSDGVTTELVE